MVQSEGIREVAFSPRGNSLLMEKLAAYEASPDFNWFMFGRERASVLKVSLGEKPTVAPLPREPHERLWITNFSPSGAKAAINWFDGTMIRAGVYNVDSDELDKLDLPGSVSVLELYKSPLWLSDDEFVLFSQPLEAQRFLADYIGGGHERRSELAQQSWKGERAAVTVLGSGKHWIEQGSPQNTGALLRVDVRTGRSSELGSGHYSQLSLSSDRGRLAALREVADADLSDARAKTLVGMGKQLELVVYDFTRGKPEVIPCKSCNVTVESLRWSPGGYKLFFSARVKSDGSVTHEYYIYDFRRDVLQQFVPSDINIEMGDDVSQSDFFVTPVTWLTDEMLAVRVKKTASPAAMSESGQKESYDWFAAGPGHATVALTEGLTAGRKTAALENLVAVRNGKLLIMADGELWEIAMDGRRRNLTEHIDEPLTVWCAKVRINQMTGGRSECAGFTPTLDVRPVDGDALAKGWLTFQINRNGVITGDLLFLNVDSGRTIRIGRPDPNSHLVSASALAQSAVFYSSGRNGDRVLLVAAGGATRELLHINRHLAGVATSEPMLLTRRGPGEAHDQYDWLLLPPDHKPGKRYPLLIQFYPGDRYKKEWRGEDLRTVSFFNWHIAAAKGYAVLRPTVHIAQQSITLDPMTEIHEQLIRAAENAVQAGFADPDRWAITGQSYGGYGTNSVVTQTDRFKAAIPVVGLSNLTSSYGGALSGALQISDKTTVSASWAEGGQGRIGTTPWENPLRYIANSPLFHAHKIRTPLMLIHGDADPVVPVSESEQLFHALLRQGKDAVFLRYWGEGHVIRSPANIRDMWNRIVPWLDEHLDVKRDADGRVLQ